MYCDFRLVTPMVAPQMMPRPSALSSGHLFQMLSFALDRNLNDFLTKRVQQKAKFQANTILNYKQAKKSETVFIDLESDQENSQKNIDQQINVGKNNVKLCHFPQSTVDLQHKQSILRTKQIQVPSQTPSQVSKEQQIKQMQQEDQKEFRLKYSCKLPEDNDFVLFTVECPKLGISNSQLLRKKQRLQRRRVNDWAQVDKKGPKQRRQIRMLKN